MKEDDHFRAITDDQCEAHCRMLKVIKSGAPGWYDEQVRWAHVQKHNRHRVTASVERAIEEGQFNAVLRALIEQLDLMVMVGRIGITEGQTIEEFMIHKVCEVAYERASDVAEWILDSGLPAVEDIDWGEIQSDRRRVKNEPTVEGLSNLNIHARVLRNIDPRLARTQHTEEKTLSGSDYLHTLKEVCELIGIKPTEENRRRLTRLSKVHHGPLHSPGQGKKKTIFEKVVVQKWFNDLQRKEAALAERRAEQHAQEKAVASTAYDITSRKAHRSERTEEHVDSDHLSTDRRSRKRK